MTEHEQTPGHGRDDQQEPQPQSTQSMSWSDPRTVIALIALLAFLAFIGYLSSQANSWARLMATYNGFIPIVTAIIGGVLGIQINGGRIREAKEEKVQADHHRRRAEQQLGHAKQVLAKADVVLGDVESTHRRRAHDSTRHLLHVESVDNLLASFRTTTAAGGHGPAESQPAPTLPMEETDPELVRLADQAQAVSSEIKAVLRS
ncbi:MAG: hypothetical protein JO222_13455 [Frankiales bacterium]|nr:hypothetical protein [Frankiales bacterium]